jgi:hypothetical protein
VNINAGLLLITLFVKLNEANLGIIKHKIDQMSTVNHPSHILADLNTPPLCPFKTITSSPASLSGAVSLAGASAFHGQFNFIQEFFGGG